MISLSFFQEVLVVVELYLSDVTYSINFESTYLEWENISLSSNLVL